MIHFAIESTPTYRNTIKLIAFTCDDTSTNSSIVWAGITDDNLIGLYVLSDLPNGRPYLQFLRGQLMILLEEVFLLVANSGTCILELQHNFRE